MELDELKDLIFDFLNENDEMLIADIETREKEDTFVITTVGGSVYEIKFQEISG